MSITGCLLFPDGEPTESSFVQMPLAFNDNAEEATCPSCSKNLSKFSSIQRTNHINRCLDSADNCNAKRKIIKCPLCHNRLPLGPFRFAHLKRCGRMHSVAPSLLLNLINSQENAVVPSLGSVGCVLKKTKAERLTGLPKSVNEEQMQLAKAISISLSNEDSTVKFEKDEKRLKQTFLPTLLQSTDSEQRLVALQDRLCNILASNLPASVFPCQQPTVPRRWPTFEIDQAVYAHSEIVKKDIQSVDEPATKIVPMDPFNDIKADCAATFIDDMKRLMTSAHNADVSIYCGSTFELVQLHSIILHVRCPTLMNLVCKTSGGDFELFLSDVEKSTFESFVRFVYFADEMFFSQPSDVVKNMLNRFQPSGWQINYAVQSVLEENRSPREEVLGYDDPEAKGSCSVNNDSSTEIEQQRLTSCFDEPVCMYAELDSLEYCYALPYTSESLKNDQPVDLSNDVQEILSPVGCSSSVIHSPYGITRDNLKAESKLFSPVESSPSTPNFPRSRVKIAEENSTAEREMSSPLNCGSFMYNSPCSGAYLIPEDVDDEQMPCSSGSFGMQILKQLKMSPNVVDSFASPERSNIATEALSAVSSPIVRQRSVKKALMVKKKYSSPYMRRNYVLKKVGLSTPVSRALMNQGIYVLKKGNVTPPVDYSKVPSPDIQGQLKKFGMRPLPRRKAVPVLERIYSETHLVISTENGTVYNDDKEAVTSSNAACETPEPQKKKRVIKARKLSDRMNTTCLLNDVECTVHEAIRTFIVNDAQLYESALCYMPINVKNFKKQLKDNGVICTERELVKFLDEQGVITDLSNK